MRFRPALFLCALVATLSLGSCFTGIESTPRISENDVRRQQAAAPSAEDLFPEQLAALPPSQWRAGHPRLLVDNDTRIQRVLAPSSADFSLAPGAVFTFQRFEPAVSLTGQDATDVVFGSDRGTFVVRVAKPIQTLDTMSVLTIPFTVDLDLVAVADSLLRGRRLFVRTPLWYDDSGERVYGLRHVAVKVDSVVAGTSNYPAAVFFSLENASDISRAAVAPGHKRMVLMNLGNDRRSSRSFASLFSFTDPRRRYPDISDDIWELIVQSRVRDGMTRDECRLALGAPSAIRRVPAGNGMAEMWSYSDGVFLVFEDGFLTRWRL